MEVVDSTTLPDRSSPPGPVTAARVVWLGVGTLTQSVPMIAARIAENSNVGWACIVG